MNDLSENIKVSELPILGSISDNDLFLVSKERSGLESDAITSQVIKNYVYENISSDICEKINECLPLSGGIESAMSGTIFIESDIALKKKGNEETPLVLVGGEEDNNSSKLKLYSDNLKGFELEATKFVSGSTTSSTLKGQYDKKLTWCDKNIVRSVNGQYANDEGNVTIARVLSADSLSKPVQIKIDGDVSGSASFNGSSDVTINATVKDNSHNHTIGNVTGLQSNLDDLQTNLNNKLNISNRTDLSTNLSSTTNVPTCKSVVDWCNSNFLKSVGFDDPTEVITMLQSMMSESDMVCYVDQISGNDSNDGSINKPFKTIYKAVQTANKRRFIGNSQCYIYLKSDINLTVSSDGRNFGENVNGTIKKVNLYHPDFTQTKFLTLSSYNKEYKKTIVCNLSNIITYYQPIISVNCNVSMKYLKFDGLIPQTLHKDFSDDVYKRESYFIYCNNQSKLIITGCEFRNLVDGVLSAYDINSTLFEYCYRAIFQPDRSYGSHTGGLQIKNCYQAFVARESSFLQVRNEMAEPIIITTYSHRPFIWDDGSSLEFLPVTGATRVQGYWEFNDEGVIISDAPNTGYENCYIKIGNITVDGNENETINSIDYSSLENLFNSLFNVEYKGKTQMYTDTGHINLKSSYNNTKKLLTYGENFDWNGNKITT